MRIVRLTVDIVIIITAGLIAFLIALSALNMKLGNTFVEYLVGGRPVEGYGVQFDANGHVVDLTPPPSSLSVETTASQWVDNIQPSARAYYSQPTVSDAYVQWGAR